MNYPFYNRITSVPAGIYVVATPADDINGDYINPAGEFFTLELTSECKEGTILGTLEDAIIEIKCEKN
jgi:hypothetical protein